MSQLETFLHMGGYARYVWPAYALTFALLAGNYFLQLQRERKLRRELVRRMRAEQARQ